MPDLVLVAFSSYRKAYYVNHVQSDEWSAEGAARRILTQKKCLRDRGRALVMAHDLDRKVSSALGVREVRVRGKLKHDDADFVVL